MRSKVLDPRLRGNDEFKAVFTEYLTKFPLSNFRMQTALFPLIFLGASRGLWPQP